MFGRGDTAALSAIVVPRGSSHHRQPAAGDHGLLPLDLSATQLSKWRLTWQTIRSNPSR
ncbi:hypothetical protein NSND_50595 [Nitrospira sp. ND1]|nr:hypothetical protein NSND_50595 [Nitrospira sp. ND1]